MEQNVYNSFRPLHLLSKIVGFSLFSFDSRSFKIVFTKRDALLVIINLSFMVFLNVIYWTTVFNWKCHSSEVVKSIFPSIAYANYVAANFIKIWSFRKRQKFEEFLNLLREIDCDLDSLSIRVDYRKETRFIWIIITFVNITGLILIIFAFLTQRQFMDVNANLYIFSAYSFIVNLVLLNHFITTVNVIRTRLQYVKEIVR